MDRQVENIHESNVAQQFLSMLVDRVERPEDLVFFGGAGVSTASGIPDFRGTTGLYTQKDAQISCSAGSQDSAADKIYEGYSPEYLLSRTCLESDPHAFYSFYRDKMLTSWAQPNQVHKKLAALEIQGRLGAIITQNIDGLHQMAGSQRVIELHGSSQRNYCTGCFAGYGPEFIEASKSIPTCKRCGSQVRPDVVLYQESLPNQAIEQAIEAISQARFLIVGGTSLLVFPAAQLIEFFKGESLVIINRDPTPRDKDADVIIRCPLEAAFDF